MKKHNNPRAWLDKLSYALQKKLCCMGFCSECDWDDLLSKWHIIRSSHRLSDGLVVRSRENQQDVVKLSSNKLKGVFFEISDPFLYQIETNNLEKRGYLYIPEELAEKIVIFGDLP